MFVAVALKRNLTSSVSQVEIIYYRVTDNGGGSGGASCTGCSSSVNDGVEPHRSTAF
jgi:hypothetical protein